MKETMIMLTSTKVGNVLPALPGGPHAEYDALGKGIQGIQQLELRVTSKRDHLVHLLELEGDHTEARHEGLEALAAQVLVLPADRVARLRHGLELVQTHPAE